MIYIGRQFAMMSRCLAKFSILLILLCGCGHDKKPSLSGDETVAVNDFIESFDLLKPSYYIADTTVAKSEKDSLLISAKVFAQFVPDSVIVKLFGKNAKPKIYVGKRVEVEDKEKYLFVKAMANSKKMLLVLCFDRKNNFKDYLPLLVVDNNPATSQLSGIDRQFSFFKTTILEKRDGTSAEGKEVYAFLGDEEKFTLIMTDALDDRVREVINPIDTLPRKNKFSADYVKDKMNLVSIRDDVKPGRLKFFIHFDQNDGACSGELKGVASFKSSTTAVYQQPGDACSLQFTFTSTAVSIKELEPCGSHRGVKCSFDGRFPKKKEAKSKSKAKSK